MAYKTIDRSQCSHSHTMQHTASDAKKCTNCDIQQHLRLCTSCGQAFCCESGKAHNKEHFQATGHPVIMSLGEGTPFTWCYECNAYIN